MSRCLDKFVKLFRLFMALLPLMHPIISKFLINLLTTQPQLTVMALATASAISLVMV